MPAFPFEFPRPLCSVVLPNKHQPADQILADIRLQGGVEEFDRQVAQGVPVVRSWLDLTPAIRQLSGAGPVPDWMLEAKDKLDAPSILWLAGHAATILDRPPGVADLFSLQSYEVSMDWSDLWKYAVLSSVVPPNINYLPQRRSAAIHLMVSLALSFDLPCPFNPNPYTSSIQDAAIILAGCLTPLQSFSTSLPDVLPPNWVPRVREWLLDGLMDVQNPYSSNARLIDGSTNTPKTGNQVARFRNKHMAGHVGLWPSGSRAELAWALDNTTAVWLKQGTRVGLEHFPTINLLENFQIRLKKWPQANAALARTNGYAVGWPGRPAKLMVDSVDPVSVHDLICATALPDVFVEMVCQKKLLTTKVLVDWLKRPNKSAPGTGDLYRLCAKEVPAAQRSKLVRHVFSLLGVDALPGESGGTVAHIFLAQFPVATSVSLLARVLGTSALLVPDDAGQTPMDKARAVVDESGVGSPRAAAIVAGMERALLLQNNRATSRTSSIKFGNIPRKSRKI